MVKSFLFVLLLMFIVLGLCEVIYIFKMFFYYPNTRLNNFLLVVLTKGYALKELEFFWQKIRWYGDSLALEIIAITDSIDKNELNDCMIFAKNKKITLCSAELIANCKQLKGS